MGKIFLLFFILSYLFKYIYLEIRTNSPLYCLKGKTCELQIISEEAFTEEQNCSLSENKTICSCTYNTTNDNQSNICNGYNFIVIIFSMNFSDEEEEQMFIKIENYDKLNDITIISVSDDYELYSNEGDIIKLDLYDYVTGELYFSINNNQSTNKTVDSGTIIFPLIYLQTYYPHYISTVEDINVPFIIPIGSSDFEEYFKSPKLKLNDTFYDLTETGKTSKFNDITFKYYSTENISFPPSKIMYEGYLIFQSIFENNQSEKLFFVPINVNISKNTFFYFVNPKKTSLEINILGFNMGLTGTIIAKNSTGETIDTIYEDNILEIYDENFGVYDIYILIEEYYEIKTSAQFFILYRIAFEENQIKFGRFISPYNISLYLKDIIMINKVYAVLINKDNNEQDDTIEFTFDEETKLFSLKNPIEKAGNYQLSIINKYDSTDFIDYPFVIYDTINLEKKIYSSK